MLKKYFIALSLVFTLSTTLAYANNGIMMNQGGYSGVRQLEMNSVQNDLVNQAVNELSNPANEENNESNYVPASSYKSNYSYKKGDIDATGIYGYGELPVSGVNESKTIYTDDMGRLHFFGKGSEIKEIKEVKEK